MKIYFISPIGYVTPDLFSSFIPTFESKGHTIVNDVKDADVVFFDLHSRLGGYNWEVLNVVIEKEISVVFWDAWDYGGCQDETSQWFGFNLVRGIEGSWTNFFIYALEKCKVVYFMRKMDKTLDYPSWVYPYELCYYKDHDFEPVSKEELFNRPNDICFIGNTSPTRENVIKDLKDHFKCDFSLGQERLPHEEWLNRHRQSKMFLEACGGGFGSERPYQLITIAPMLRVHSNHLIHEDFLDGEDCWEINEIPSEVNIESLKFLLNSQVLYQIYLKGIERMKTYFNEEYRANYILSVLKQEGIC